MSNYFDGQAQVHKMKLSKMAITSPSAVLAVLEYTNIQLVEYLKLNPSLPIKLLLV